MLLLGFSSYPRHCMASFIQASIHLLHSAWHRWCGMNHLVALPVNVTEHVVDCLSFVYPFLPSPSLGLSWGSSHLHRSPLPCMDYAGISSFDLTASAFCLCSSLRKMTRDKNITWNSELARQIGNYDCSFQPRIQTC